MWGKIADNFENALYCTLLDVSLTVEMGELGFFPSGGVTVCVLFFLRANKSKPQQWLRKSWVTESIVSQLF